MPLKPAAASCPFCQAVGNFQFIRDAVNKDGNFSLYRCSDCGGEYFSPFFHPGGDWYENGDSYNVKENGKPRHIHSYHKYFLSKHHDLRSKVALDLGCGTGEFLGELSKRGVQAYGVDIDRTAIAIAKKFFPNVNFSAQPIANFCSQPPRNDFDYLTMFEVFEHVDNPIAILTAAKNLLKSDGLLTISLPSRERIFVNSAGWDYPYHHLSRWNGKAFHNILTKNGFREIKVIYINRYNQLRELFLDNLADRLNFRSARKLKATETPAGENHPRLSLPARLKKLIIKLIYPLARFVGVKLLPNALAIACYPFLAIFYPRSGVMYIEAKK